MNLETIGRDRFAPYGTVLELVPEAENPVFQIPVEVPDAPWRIAVLKVLPRALDRVECHPDSRESFEPVSGWTVLFAGSEPRPEALHAFVLDRPVCLYKGVWHGVVTLTPESVCKLTENLEVSIVYAALPRPLSVGVV